MKRKFYSFAMLSCIAIAVCLGLAANGQNITGRQFFVKSGSQMAELLPVSAGDYFEAHSTVITPKRHGVLPKILGLLGIAAVSYKTQQYSIAAKSNGLIGNSARPYLMPGVGLGISAAALEIFGSKKAKKATIGYALYDRKMQVVASGTAKEKNGNLSINGKVPVDGYLQVLQNVGTTISEDIAVDIQPDQGEVIQPGGGPDPNAMYVPVEGGDPSFSGFGAGFNYYFGGTWGAPPQMVGPASGGGSGGPTLNAPTGYNANVPYFYIANGTVNYATTPYVNNVNILTGIPDVSQLGSQSINLDMTKLPAGNGTNKQLPNFCVFDNMEIVEGFYGGAFKQGDFIANYVTTYNRQLTDVLSNGFRGDLVSLYGFLTTFFISTPCANNLAINTALAKGHPVMAFLTNSVTPGNPRVVDGHEVTIVGYDAPTNTYRYYDSVTGTYLNGAPGIFSSPTEIGGARTVPLAM